MRIAPARLDGLFLVDLELQEDSRGFFARTMCRAEFSAAGMFESFAQECIAHNKLRGTLRGLHYALPPHAETKMVRCVRGAVFDVVVDLRSDSSTFGEFEAFELDEHNRRALYVPVGFAHGYQTLEDATELLYALTPAFVPQAAAGILWDDPALAIPWPIGDRIVSERDGALEPLEKTEVFSTAEWRRSA